MELPFGWALPNLARRLPTFFHGSTSVRTEAYRSGPPIVFPSATPHVFLWFCFEGKAIAAGKRQPLAETLDLGENALDHLCLRLCLRQITIRQGNDLPRWQHRAPQSRHRAQRMIRKRLMVKTLPAFGVLPA